MSRRLPIAVELMLWPVAGLYRLGVALRNFCFDRGFILVDGVSAQVLSVGNLTAGGTGKTPLTAFLVRGFLARKKRVGIVSRGYGGTERGPAHVPKNGLPETAARFGDEPTWFAHVLPEVAVAIASKRVAAAELLTNEDDVDVIVADDAFQHRYLRRRMDVVVIDASEPRWHYRGLPVGRMREGFSALSRAHAIFISKTNLAKPEDLVWLRERIDEALKRFEAPPFIFEVASVIPEFSFQGQRVPATVLKGQRVLLVSGIGRPKTFQQLIEETGASLVAHMEFKDHHAYTSADIAAVNARAKALDAEAIVMTEKDAVKLGTDLARAGFLLPCYVSCLEMRVIEDARGTSIEDFYEAFDRAVF